MRLSLVLCKTPPPTRGVPECQNSSGVQECQNPLLSILSHFVRIQVLGTKEPMAACVVQVSLQSESASSMEFYIK